VAQGSDGLAAVHEVAVPVPDNCVPVQFDPLPQQGLRMTSDSLNQAMASTRIYSMSKRFNHMGMWAKHLNNHRVRDHSAEGRLRWSLNEGPQAKNA